VKGESVHQTGPEHWHHIIEERELKIQ